MATIDIAAECLVDLLPQLSRACRIVGSEASPHSGVVRLRIEGDAVPNGHVTAQCGVSVSGSTHILSTTFLKA